MDVLPLLLASSSPRRKSLLSEAGLQFLVDAADIREEQVAGEAPDQMVLRLAKEKAAERALRYPESLVLGCDTTVWLPETGHADKAHGRVLGKPENAADAEQMLRDLSGREHSVFSGVCLICREKQICETFVVETRVVFRELDDDEIRDYVETKEPFDKAGAYAIQGGAGHFVSRINGSYSNVVGLPLAEVMQHLKRFGIRPCSRGD